MTESADVFPTFDACLNSIEAYRLAGSGRDGYKALTRSGAQKDWAKINEAFESFKLDSSRWDGVHAPLKGSKLYNKLITGLDFTANIMPNPFRAAFMLWALERPYLQNSLQQVAQATQESVHYDQFRGHMLEAFGQDLKAKGNCPMMADEKNNTYVTKLSDGSWKALSEEEVAGLIRGGAQGGPHVFVTANHAFLETMDDLTPITSGYEELIAEVTKGEAKLVPFDREPKAPGQTILIAATNTRENNFLNLAQLFHRLHEIDEANQKGPQTDQFRYCSPIAKQMVVTLLQSMVQDPSRIVHDQNGAPPCLVSGDAPVLLRPDAAEIIRNVQFHGFSKGGNDFRDGMRLLTHTLNRTTAAGQPLFQTEIASHDIVKDIVSNLSVTVQSLNEKPMHPWYKSRGVSVTYFSNRHDTIALPPEIEYTQEDPSVVYHGPTKANGHYPGVIMENLSHPYILQHYRCALASLAQKPAIRFVLYQEISEGHGLVLKTAPGTTDAMVESSLHMLEAAFNKAGLQDSAGNPKIKIRRIEGAHGCERYELYSTQGPDDLLSRGCLFKLTQAFDALRCDASIPVVVSSAITDPCLPTLAKDVVIARRGYEGVQGIDWKDKIKVTGGEIYDRRIHQINTFMGADPMLFPVDPPQMSASASAGRGH